MRFVRGFSSAVKLLLAALVVVAVGLVWLASVALPWALLRGNAELPAWAPWAASAAVFPVVPLLWHALAERRMSGKTLLRRRDRLVLRAVAVAGLSTAGLCVGVPTQVGAQWDAVRTLARAHLPPAILDWLSAVVPARDLVAYAPRDATWVVVGDLRELDDSWFRDSELRSPELEACGVSLTQGRTMFALGTTSAGSVQDAMLAVQADGLGRDAARSCLSEALSRETEGALRLEWNAAEDGGWHGLRLHYRDPQSGRTSTMDTSVFVADADTLIAVTPSWKDAAIAALAGRGSAKDGALRTPLARVSTDTPFWGVAAYTVGSTKVDAGGSIEFVGDTVHWNASADTGDLDQARALERELATAKEYFTRWTTATSWVAWGEGDAWQLGLEVHRDETLVRADFVVGREALLRVIVLGALAL